MKEREKNQKPLRIWKINSSTDKMEFVWSISNSFRHFHSTVRVRCQLFISIFLLGYTNDVRVKIAWNVLGHRLSTRKGAFAVNIFKKSLIAFSTSLASGR